MLRITRKELAPGVQLTAVHTQKFKTCLLGVTFLAALSQETAAENALIPAVLRRGTKNHPDMESLSAALDDLYGGSIEPMVRKKGETHCIGFVGSFLDDKYVPEESRILESAADLMAELLFAPAGTPGEFHQEYLDGERVNLISRIRAQMNEKRQYSMTRLVEEMCAGEAYGVNKLGTADSAAKITAQNLWHRYEALLSGAPVEMYYCGSAPLERLEQALKPLVSRLSGTFRKEKPICNVTVKAPSEPRFFEDHMDVTQGKLALGFRLDSDFYETSDLPVLMMLNAVYGGTTTSKLFMNVREKLSLCYFASSLLDKHKGLMLVSSGIEFDKFEQAKTEILDQLNACRTGSISGEELESARRFVISSLQAVLDSQGKLEDYWLGQSVSDQTVAPEELARSVAKVNAAQMVQMAVRMRLDSIYFLNGKGALNR